MTSKKNLGTYHKVSASKSKKKRSASKTQTIKRPYQIRRKIITSDLTKRLLDLSKNAYKKNTIDAIIFGLLTQVSEMIDFARSSKDYQKVVDAHDKLTSIYDMAMSYKDRIYAIDREKFRPYFDELEKEINKLYKITEFYTGTNMPKEVDEWYQGYYGRKNW